MQIPEDVQQLIRQHHEAGISADACLSCSSGCCSQGGFAILENVLAIYDLYRAGKLRRRHYSFPKGMSFRDFVLTHFDLWVREVGPENEREEMVFFHMRSIDRKGRPIRIPGGGSYWAIRTDLFDGNPWLNWGCVFLSHRCPNWPKDDGLRKRHCILHTAESHDQVGPKPIDCLFYTCTEPYRAKIPTADESDAWFASLAKAFPRSKERLEALIGES